MWAVAVVCGKEGGYRAVVIASEPITSDEAWVEVPEASLLWVDGEVRLRVVEL